MAAHFCPNCGWPLHNGYFDDARQAVVIDGKPRPVTAMRWKLLQFFRSHPGQRLDREWIYAALYGGRDKPPDMNTLKVHIFNLRQDIDGTPYHIVTRDRLWYQFDVLTKPH